MALRTLEHGFDPKHCKHYVHPETAEEKARVIAAGLSGMVNVTIAPILVQDRLGHYATRYTALFSCFEDEQDIARVAHHGFYCFR